VEKFVQQGPGIATTAQRGGASEQRRPVSVSLLSAHSLERPRRRQARSKPVLRKPPAACSLPVSPASRHLPKQHATTSTGEQANKACAALHRGCLLAAWRSIWTVWRCHKTGRPRQAGKMMAHLEKCRQQLILVLYSLDRRGELVCVIERSVAVALRGFAVQGHHSGCAAAPHTSRPLCTACVKPSSASWTTTWCTPSRIAAVQRSPPSDAATTGHVTAFLRQYSHCIV